MGILKTVPCWKAWKYRKFNLEEAINKKWLEKVLDITKIR
jgi:hypothetical protein